MTGVSMTINSNVLTVAASAAGSWGVAIGATLTHASIPGGTTITGYTSTTSATMSANASATLSSQTVTATNPTNINIDAVPGVVKTGGDVYNISGPTFTIDQDSRFGLNEINTSVTAASTLGSITNSATLGGTIEVDSRYIRMVPFNTGSGTITPGTTITMGSGTGKVISIYSALNAAPVYTAVSGWIKVKAWNGISFPTSGTFTQAGFTFTISGADSAGFLFIQGDESSTVTANRLGLFRMRGDYWLIGTTAGARTDTYQLPTHGSAIDIASIEVETSSGSGVYETYVCANTITATAATMATDWRGKVFWLARTTGVLRFGHDGTNLTGGYLPPSGCKIRMYNLITVNNTAAARNVHAVPNATLGTRYDLTTTGGGVLSFDKCNLAWYPSFSQAYSVITTNTSVCDAMTISENSTIWEPNNLVIAPAPTTAVQQSLTIRLMPAGITFTNCFFARLTVAGAGAYNVVTNDTGDVICNNTKSIHLTYQGNAGTGGWSVTRSKSWLMNTGNIFQRALFSQMSNLKIYSPVVYDHPATATPATTGRVGVDLSYVTDFLIEGWSNGALENCQPYAGLINMGAGCVRGVIQNIGTYAAPLSLGGTSLVHALAWTRSTTTATVTHNNHNLITGSSINVVISSDVAAIVLGQKSITVTNANTYTFTCLNAGAASGTISARGAVCALPISTAASSACSDIIARKIYFVGGRGTALGLGDNSNSKFTIKNVYDLDFFNAGNNQLLNSVMSGTAWTGTTTAVAGQYGTHWFDHKMYGAPSNLSALAYTRSTTTATVTQTDHGLYTGCIVNVTVASDAATIPSLGPKSITVLTKDTWTFTVTNAGAASGTITIQVLNSRVQCMFNEATSLTSSYVTTVSGSANFTSAGSCLLPAIGDTVQIESTEFVKGISAFRQNVPVMSGGTITNFNVTYDIDTGSGYTGVFKNLSRNQTISGTSGQFTITVTDSTVLKVGDCVVGTNVAGLAKITILNSPTQITVDKANIGTVSGTGQFFYHFNEVIDPSVGFKFKWRFTRLLAGTDAITFYYIWAYSSATDTQIQYPVPGVQLTLSGLVTGSDITVLQAGTETVLINKEDNVGTTYVYEYTVQQNVDIAIYKPGYMPAFIRNYTLGSANASLPVSQTPDLSYI